MFAKFKEMLTTLHVSISFHEILELMPKFVKFMQALLKGKEEKMIKEHVKPDRKARFGKISTLPSK